MGSTKKKSTAKKATKKVAKRPVKKAAKKAVKKSAKKGVAKPSPKLSKPRLTAKQVMAELKQNGSAQTVKIYRNHGVTGDFYGVSYAFLKKLHKRVKVDHELGLRGLRDELAGAGVRVVLDTCTYYTPVTTGVEGTVMTNSAKWAYYAPGILGIDVAFGSLGDCVESAIAGEVLT